MFKLIVWVLAIPLSLFVLGCGTAPSVPGPEYPTVNQQPPEEPTEPGRIDQPPPEGPAPEGPAPEGPAPQ